MPEPDTGNAPVVVVGGGWAGLATAVSLARGKQPVLVLESARQLGGRARSLRIDDTVYDNGQHLMIGAYRAMLTLMEEIGVEHREALRRLPLTLHLQRGEQTALALRARRLPAPLHLLGALLTAQGLSLRERILAMRFAKRLRDLKIDACDDISVQALLHSEGQTPRLNDRLWIPLCIATLNTPADMASARLFAAVLTRVFAGINRHADLLIPQRELSEMLPRPAARFIEDRGGRIELGQRVSDLHVEGGRARGVQVNGARIDARAVVLATPHVITRRLLSRQPRLAALAERLARLGNEPVSTLYLQYPAQTRLPLPVMGLQGEYAQWIFDRRVCEQPGMMAVVISARGEHVRMDAEQLTQAIADELAACFPHWPRHLGSQLIREKRATFCAAVGIDAIRPANRTPLAGLWLAGDYTATDLPATLEGAVESGVRCADSVLETLRP